MGNGWIKLHRKLLAKGYYRNSQYVHLWVHLLLLANHKEHEYMHDGGIIMVKEGQLITGRKELSRATGIPETTIERILKMLENEHQIGQQKTTKYRVITILNWTEHQNRTGERTTNGQQTDTYKNDKNEKNTAASLRSSGFSLEVLEEDENQKPRKEPRNPETKKLTAAFRARCRREFGREPSWSLVSGWAVVNRALAKTSVSNLKDMMEQWFDGDKKESDMMQITQCFSAYQIDKYLSEYA